eukprot:g13521.t1
MGLGGRQAAGEQFVTDENGVLLRNKDAILKRWRRFFDTLLNSKSPTLNPDVVEQVAQRPTTRATRRLAAVSDPEEVEAASKGLGSWKAVGPDLLAAKLLKVDGDDEPMVLERLRAVFVEVWNGGEMPQEWKDATIKVLYKKGDLSNCNNFRGISLLSHVGRVLAKTITNRLTFCEANDILPEEQCGFRPGRSTVCMLFVVRRLQELGRRRRIPFYMCFIDLQKAYDSVDRELLWKLLLRVIGHRRKRGTHRQLSYAQALKWVGCQSVEATIRQRLLLFAEAVARHPDKLLPKRLMFGELAGGEKPGKGSPEQNWLTCLKDDLRVFGATNGSMGDAPCVFGVPNSVWSEVATVEGPAGVLQGAERFMAAWHKDEEEASLQRAIKRGDSGPNNSLYRYGGNQRGGKGGGETAQDESKREEADRVARYVED